MAAASPSLFLFFPGKCDSFLLEGRGVRKGDEREQDGTPILRTCGWFNRAMVQTCIPPK